MKLTKKNLLSAVSKLMQCIPPFLSRPAFALRLFALFLLLASAWTSSAQTVDLFNPSPDGSIYGLATVTDTKVLIGGAFSTVGGQFGGQIAQFKEDGTIDVRPHASVNGTVFSLVVQPDGMILVGGSFNYLEGMTQLYIARMKPNLRLDTNFLGKANSTVNAMALQTDGKILVGGLFTNLTGSTRLRLGRLNANGSIDQGFTAGADGTVSAIALQTDGKILVGGSFTTLAGVVCSRIGRLNPNGTFDATFNANANNAVRCFVVQPDGKILVGGSFTNLSGTNCLRLGRLHPDGTLDTTFNGPSSGAVVSLALQVDGKILAGGSFTNLGGGGCTNIGRLLPNGTLDSTFKSRASAALVAGLMLQTDGKIVLGGSFTNVSGVSRTNLARLNNTEAAIQSLSFDTSTIQWTRSATSPEVLSTTFEASTNSRTWFSLGAGTRTFNGWQVDRATLPDTASVRARGTIIGGQFNASSGFAEVIHGKAVFVTEPVSRTNNAATTATFTASALGPALQYKWLKNGTNLSDTPTIIGTGSPTLTLSNVFGIDSGGYSLVISNPFGAVTSVVAVLHVVEPILSNHPASQFVHVGQNASLTVGAIATAPTYQWRKEGVDLPGLTQSLLTITNLQWSDRGNYDAVVTSPYGISTSLVASLVVNAAPADALDLAANGPVACSANLPDGSMLLGGEFTAISGEPRLCIAKLRNDGTLDPTFSPAVSGQGGCYYCPTTVASLAVQPDGKIIVGGHFTSIAGGYRNGLARLHPDGTLDTAFNPNLIGSDAYAGSLCLQSDGKILVNGGHSFYRLNSDGTIDSTFAGNMNSVLGLQSIAVQPDGKILLGGDMGNGLTRLNSDGSPDTAFNPIIVGPPGTGLYLSGLVVQPDGKIVISGNIHSVNGQIRMSVARLKADGSLDSTFDPNVAPGPVYDIGLQANGKIVIGGTFTSVGGQLRRNIARLLSDGAPDPQVDPRSTEGVTHVNIAENGSVFVSGYFTNVGGQTRSYAARLNNPDAAHQMLEYSNSTISWMRSGACPEFSYTTFEARTNDAGWFPLGVGSRAASQWNFSAAGIPPAATIRARGFLASDSHSFAEAVIGPMVIANQPSDRTNAAGTLAFFNAAAVGSEAIYYQWRRNGQALTDGGKISGTRTPTLVISNVFGIDQGSYSVIVSNATGVLASQAASLSVIDPVINTQPVSQSLRLGTNATLTTSVVGTHPISYQWRKDGTNLPSATSAHLTLTDVQRAHAGLYVLVATTPFGSATSSVASITVNLALPDSFAPDIYSSGNVMTLAAQTNGHIVIGGNFTSISGIVRYGLARIKPDGLVDTSFPNLFQNPTTVNAVAVQADGKILVGGQFFNLGGQSQSIGRLNSNGTVDTNFVASAATVYAVAVAPDGKILLGGTFNSLNSISRTNFGRLHPDGSLDTAFLGNANNLVRTITLQPDGRILIGGRFTRVHGVDAALVARLNVDGTIDPSFYVNPPVNGSDQVYAIAAQPDGKIIVAGNFNSLGGQACSNIARLNPDGTFDTTWNVRANTTVTTLALQSDAKTVVGGFFTQFAGLPRYRLARLNRDGSLDTLFDPAANRGVNPVGGVNALLLQPDGALVVAGWFTNVAGLSRTGMARLINTDPAASTLAFGHTNLLWSRKGTAPDVWHTQFEMQSGDNWIPLGTGSRIAEGWTLDAAVPILSTVRARGYVSGAQNGSSWIVETTAIRNEPSIVLKNIGLDLLSAQFHLTMEGQGNPISILENSTNLTDWLPLSTNALGAEPISVTQPASTPHRFYRVRVK